MLIAKTASSANELLPIARQVHTEPIAGGGKASTGRDNAQPRITTNLDTDSLRYARAVRTYYYAVVNHRGSPASEHDFAQATHEAVHADLEEGRVDAAALRMLQNLRAAGHNEFALARAARQALPEVPKDTFANFVRPKRTWPEPRNVSPAKTLRFTSEIV